MSLKTCIFYFLCLILLPLSSQAGNESESIPSPDDEIDISQAPLTKARAVYGAHADLKNSIIYFYDEETKANYRLHIVDGLLYEENGRLFNRWLTQNIVIDPNGDLYFIPKYFAAKMKHSTPTAGKEVILAGSAKFKNGRIIYIDNDSGHYWPTLKSFYWGLLILKSKGLDLSTAKVFFMGASRAYTSPIFSGFVPQFLRSAYSKLTANRCETLL